jgi:hypothetical protein
MREQVQLFTSGRNDKEKCDNFEFTPTWDHMRPRREGDETRFRRQLTMTRITEKP